VIAWVLGESPTVGSGDFLAGDRLIGGSPVHTRDRTAAPLGEPGLITPAVLLPVASA
jgi:hypothetical protein